MTGPRLYGRETDLRALAALTGRLADGRGGALVIRGESGLGKSSLLAAAAGSARDRGSQVLTAGGVECEMHLPFAGLHQLLRPLFGRLDHLPARQREALKAAFGMTDAAAPELFLIALATLELLAEAAACAPLLIIADDAHWLDRPSSDVLGFVARRVIFEPVVLLFALHDLPGSGLGLCGLPERRIEPLAEAAAAALLDAHAPGLLPGVRERLLAAAAGNPLALVELPATVGAEQLGRASPMQDQLPLTGRLEQAFVSRVAALPASTRTVLLVAAADDAGVLAEVLAAAAGVARTDIGADVLEPAVAARLVEVSDGRLSFRHPLVRSAIYQAAVVGDRQAAHAALATVLGNSIQRRVWHRSAAVSGPDEGLAAELESLAADAQRRGAIAIAVAALRRAAELTQDPGRRGSLLLRAAEHAVDLGRRDVVDGLLKDTETIELGTADLARLRWIEEMTDPGVIGDAASLRSLADAAETARTAGDTDLALSLLWLAASRCFWGDPGQDIRQRIVTAADRLGPQQRRDPRLLGILAYAAPIERGRVVIDGLLQAGHGRDVVADRLHGSAAIAVGAFDIALPFLTAAAAGLRRQGRLGHLPRVLVQQGWAAIETGDLSVAVPAAEEAHRLAAETGDVLWAAGARIDQAMLAARRGASGQVDDLTRYITQVAAPVGARFMLAVTQLIRGVSALAGGRHDAAYEQLCRLFDPPDPVFHHFIRLWALGDLAEAATQAGQAAAVRALIAGLAPLAGQTPSPSVQIGLRYANALLAADADAEPLFQRALNAELGRWPFARGRLLLAYGSWLRRQRRVAESRGPLHAARDCFDAIAAPAWGDRARQELRASGESSRRRVPEARDQLTPQELQIAQLAAAGRSNRQIGQQLYLSHRTVSSHLYRIFPKLGVSSRSELRAALHTTLAARA